MASTNSSSDSSTSRGTCSRLSSLSSNSVGSECEETYCAPYHCVTLRNQTITTIIILLTLGACAARVTVLGLSVCLSVCLFVCLSVTAILPPRAIRCLTRGTRGYSATCTRLSKRRFLYKCFVKKLGSYFFTAKKSAIFTLVHMCEAILNTDTHDVICKRSLQILDEC